MSRASRRRARRNRRAQIAVDPRRVDLHMHTDRSDGLLTLEQTVQACISGRLDIVSITDHDLPPALPSGRIVRPEGEFHHIQGVELTASFQDTEQHLLVYFPQEMPTDFKAFCTQRSVARAQRYNEMIDRLSIDGLDYADSNAIAGQRSLTRLHLAIDLVMKGHAMSINEAFSRWLKDLTLSERFPEMTDLIEKSKSAGGFCSWAHPDLKMAATHTKRLKSVGLDALEALRPFKAKKYRKRMQEIARLNDLHVTGGSDNHGRKDPLGAYFFSASDLPPQLHLEPTGA